MCCLMCHVIYCYHVRFDTSHVRPSVYMLSRLVLIAVPVLSDIAQSCISATFTSPTPDHIIVSGPVWFNGTFLLAGNAACLVNSSKIGTTAVNLRSYTDIAVGRFSYRFNASTVEKTHHLQYCYHHFHCGIVSPANHNMVRREGICQPRDYHNRHDRRLVWRSMPGCLRCSRRRIAAKGICMSRSISNQEPRATDYVPLVHSIHHWSCALYI